MRVCQFRHFGIERRRTTAQRGDGKLPLYCNGSVEAVKRGSKLAIGPAKASPRDRCLGPALAELIANCYLLIAALQCTGGGSGSATPSARGSDAAEFIPVLELWTTTCPRPIRTVYSLRTIRLWPLSRSACKTSGFTSDSMTMSQTI